MTSQTAERVHQRAARAMVQALRDHGVTKVFGNPGTFELPIYDELADAGIELVLTLQEVVTGAAAAGYAAYTRQPGVALMHTVAGLGNGLGALYGAAAMELPVVVLIGEPDSRTELDEPNLIGDAAAMVAGIAKRAIRLRSPDQAAVAVASALSLAAQAPRGPVVVTFPMEVLLAEGAFEVPPPSDVSTEAVAADLEQYLQPLLDAKSPLLVVGSEVAWSRAIDDAVLLAERLEIPVMSESLNMFADFPSDHRLYKGVLPAIPSVTAKVLSRHDVVLLVGAVGFRPLLHDSGYPIPASTRVLQIDSRVTRVGTRWPVERGAVGGIRASLQQLNELALKLERSTRADDRAAPAAASKPKSAPRPPVGIDAAFAAVADAFGDTFVVVDEGCTASWHVRQRFPRSYDNYFACTIGNLGHGPGYAVGVSAAAGDKPVLAIVGDGSVMYAPQALWTAARAAAPITFVVINNGGYESLRGAYKSFPSKAAETGVFPGTVIDPPTIDYVALATAHGVPGSSVGAPEDLVEALRAALARRGPTLVEYRVPPEGPAA